MSSPHQLLLVFTNPVEGREDEYNTWYDNQHLPDLLNIPGILSGERYVLGEKQRNPGGHPWKYLAIYKVEADRIGDILDTISRITGTEAMTISPALAPERFSGFFAPWSGSPVS